MRHRQIALPAGVVGLARDQRLHDALVRLILGERRHQLPLRLVHAANLVVRHRQIALPVGVVGGIAHESAGDVMAFAVGSQRPGKVPRELKHVSQLIARVDLSLRVGGSVE